MSEPRPFLAHLPAIRLALTAIGLAFLPGGCVLAPKGTREERDRLEVAGAAYTVPVERRELPEIPSPADWRSVLERAFLANGELEAAWREWQAALERIDIAAGYPNTRVAPMFSYMLSDGGMKAWDRTTLQVGFDSMENLVVPSKARRAGEQALDEARAAGERFRAAKFALQREVLEAWLELALIEERLRVREADLELLRVLRESSAARLRAGGPQSQLERVLIEVERGEDALASLRAARAVKLAELNARLARSPQAPLELSTELPEPRPIEASDSELLRAGAAENPELAALSAEVAGRADALELARLAYVPDFNPFAAITGDVFQMVGTGIMLPTTLPQIQAGVREARAMLERSRAMLGQAIFDRAGRFVAALYALRDAERQTELFERRILPAAQRVEALLRQGYVAGSDSYADLIEGRRILLEVQLTIAEARIERERRLAELEELAGIDVETLGRAPESRMPGSTEERHAEQELPR